MSKPGNSEMRPAERRLSIQWRNTSLRGKISALVVIAGAIGGAIKYLFPPRQPGNPPLVHQVATGRDNVQIVGNGNTIINNALTEPSHPVATSRTTRPTSRPGDMYLHESALAGHAPANPIAVKGDRASADEVLRALGIPPQLGLFKQAFFSDGTFDRALDNGQVIAGLRLPREIDKIVLLQVETPKRVAVPEAAGAVKAIEAVHIAVIEARTGSTLASSRFVAEGIGFNDESIRASLHDDLVEKLGAARRALQYP